MIFPERSFPFNPLNSKRVRLIRLATQSQTVAVTLGGLIRASQILEQLGKRILLIQWRPPHGAVLFLGAAIGATLMTRSLILLRFGAEEGRWWLPLGVIFFWGVLAVGCGWDSTARRKSRFFSLLKRWLR